MLDEMANTKNKHLLQSPSLTMRIFLRKVNYHCTIPPYYTLTSTVTFAATCSCHSFSEWNSSSHHPSALSPFSLLPLTSNDGYNGHLDHNKLTHGHLTFNHIIHHLTPHCSTHYSPSCSLPSAPLPRLKHSLVMIILFYISSHSSLSR